MKCKNLCGICDEIVPNQTLLIAIIIQSVASVKLRRYGDVLQIKAWISGDKIIAW